MGSVDLELLRVARTAGHTPERERAVARFSALGQHAAGGAWMDEGNPRGADARTWRGVDQLDLALMQIGERGVDVGNAVGDVVEARPARGEEARDDGGLRQRRE